MNSEHFLIKIQLITAYQTTELFIRPTTHRIDSYTLYLIFFHGNEKKKFTSL